jgi:hypothetical protein
MERAVSARLTGVFVPVSDIERAKAWYMRIFGLPESPVLFGHLWCAQVGDGVWLNLSAAIATPVLPGGPPESRKDIGRSRHL